MKKKLLLTIALISIVIVSMLGYSLSLYMSDAWMNYTPGLYDSSEQLIKSWDELVDDYGFDITTDLGFEYEYDEYEDKWYHYTDLTTFDYEEVDYNDIPKSIPYIALLSPELQDGYYLIIPEGVTRIGKSALYYTNLSTIYLPSTLESIGAYAFSRGSYSNSLYQIFYSNPLFKNWISEDGFLLTDSSLNNAHSLRENLTNYHYYNEWTVIDKVVDPLEYAAPGLYDEDDNLVVSWDDFVDATGFDISSDITENYYYTPGYPEDYRYNIYLQSYYMSHDDAPQSILMVSLRNPEYQSVKKMVVPEGVQTIGTAIFKEAPLTDVYLPESVRLIKYKAFAYSNYTSSVYRIHIKHNSDDYLYEDLWVGEYFPPNSSAQYTYITSSRMSIPEFAADILDDSYNTWVKTSYDGTMIERLISKYSVVTLGTRDKLSITSFPEDTSIYKRGSLLNSYSTAGGVLIRGDVTTRSGYGADRYDGQMKYFYPELAVVYDYVPSYVGGKLKGSTKQDSMIEDLMLGIDLDLYVNTEYNNLTKSCLDDYNYGTCYQLNINGFTRQHVGNNYSKEYNISDARQLSVNFDRMYESIVEEQAKIPQGTTLTYTNTDYTQPEDGVIITQPGYYNIDLDNTEGYKWKSKIVAIFNYDPYATYVITVRGEYIYTPVEIYINGQPASDVTTANSVTFSGEGNETYYGNVIVSYPEAKYIYFNKENVGHVIAPNADVEINSWRMVGAIIANSVTIEKDYEAYTAIQYYPYQKFNPSLPYSEPLEQNQTPYDYKTAITELYEGDYSLIEMLKNYNVVTLGQKNYSDSATLKNNSNANGTASITQSSAPILVSGNLGYDYSSTDVFNYNASYNSGNQFASSYVKGTIMMSTTTDDVSDDIQKNIDSDEVYVGTSNNLLLTIGYHTPYWHWNPYRSNTASSSSSMPPRQYLSPTTFASYLSSQGTAGISKPVFATDNFIDFARLYNSIYSQQQQISSGKTVEPDSNGVIYLSNGGTYTIENINNVSKIIFNTTKLDKQTIVTIPTTGEITTFPEVLLLADTQCTTGNANTNKYYNYHQAISSNDVVIDNEVYTGNLIWNIPDATYINIPSRTVIGHIIAPNADIEMPVTKSAGTIIANSLYTTGASEIHYYPYQLNSLNQNTVSLKIYNIDDVSLDNISNFKYELYDSNNNKIDSWITCAECTIYHETVALIPNQTYTIKQTLNNEPYLEVDPITFTVDENGIANATNVSAQINANGDIVIRNSRYREVNATYEFIDDDNQAGFRPDSVVVNLLANGTKIRSYTLTPTNPSFHEPRLALTRNGAEVNYTITGESIENYTSSVEHTVVSNQTDLYKKDTFKLVNTYSPAKTSITITEVWDDENNKDGSRPTSNQIEIYADNSLLNTVTVNKDDNWISIVNDLFVYSEGQPITYTIKAKDITGYTTEVTGNQTTGFTVTNKHTPKKASIRVAERWDDDNNRDGVRPTSNKIEIYADDTLVKSASISLDSLWTYSDESLDMYANGNKINYSIKVKATDGYTSTISGNDNEFIITNTHTPLKTTLKLSEKWSDENNKDGIRPDTAQVSIYLNNNLVKTVNISKNNNWEYTESDLFLNDNGKEAKYTIKAKTISGYTSIISGSYKTGYMVTNTHKVDKVVVATKTSLKITENWIDEDDKDEIRPESNTVEIYANGNLLRTISMSKISNWKTVLTNLDAYDSSSKRINYTIVVKPINGYTTEITGNQQNGYIINNIHKTEKEKVSITINEVWVDNSNYDSIRPEFVEVDIYGNDELVDTVKVEKTSNWTTTVYNLDKEIDNEPVSYTIKQKEIEGYTSKIEGNEENIYTITNTHEIKKEEPVEEKPKDNRTTTYIFMMGIGLVLIILLLLFWLKKRKKEDK